MPNYRLASLLLSLFLSSAAQAREEGTLTPNCAGCHYGDGGIAAPEVALESDLIVAPLGELLTVPLSIRSYNANAFGVLIQSKEPLSTNESSIATNEIGMGHTQPLDALDGEFAFDMLFETPLDPGVTTVDLSVVAAQRNSFAEDDTFGSRRFDIVYGCEPIVTYADEDGDGFGAEEKRLVSCTEALGVAFAGDCNDADPTISPGAEEVCNYVDDNCDGIRDDGLEVGIYHEDADGDGFGSSGRGEFTCLGPGLAVNNDDCDDSRGRVFPEALEVCNGEDDDCDGEIDEECIDLEDTCDPDEEGCNQGAACTLSATTTRRGSNLGWLLLLTLLIAVKRSRARSKKQSVGGHLPGVPN